MTIQLLSGSRGPSPRGVAPAIQHRRGSTPAAVARSTTSASSAALGTAAIAGVTLWTVLVSTLLCVIVPLLLLGGVPDSGRSDGWRWTLVVLLWAGVRLTGLIARGQPLLFQFFFWLFCYVFMGLAPTVQIRSDSVSGTTNGIDPALDERTALLVAGTLLLFELGSWAARRRTDMGGTRRSRRLHRSRAWLVLLVGAGVAAYYLRELGLGVLFQTRAELGAASADVFGGSSVLGVVRTMSWIPFLVAGGALWTARRAGSRTSPETLALLSAFFAVVVVMNPIGNPRYMAGSALFALAAITGLFRNRTRIRASFAAIVAAMLFVFPIADAFRNRGWVTQSNGFFSEYASNNDYDAFWQISNSISYVGEEGVVLGRQLLGVLLFWLPRDVWSGKPSNTGEMLAEFRGYSFTNLSAPLWAEFTVNFGVFAGACVFVAVGYLLARSDVLAAAQFRAGGPWQLAACCLAGYSLIVLRGSLLQAFGVVAVAVALVVFIHPVVRPAETRRPTTPEQDASWRTSR